MIKLFSLFAIHKPAFFVVASLSLLTILFNVGLMATSAFLIASCALHPPLYTLMTLITGVRFFGTMRGIFRYAERIVSHNHSLKIVAHLRLHLFEKLAPLAPGRLFQHQSGELIGRVMSDLELLQNFFIQFIVPFFTIFLTPFFIAMFLFFFSQKIAFIYIVVLELFSFIIMFFSWRYIRKVGFDNVAQEADLRNHLYSLFAGSSELIANNLQNLILGQIKIFEKKLFNTQWKLRFFEISANALVGMGANFFIGLILILAINMTQNNLLQPVYLPMLLLVILASFEALNPLVNGGFYLGRSEQAANRIFDIIYHNVSMHFPVLQIHNSQKKEFLLNEEKTRNNNFLYIENLSFQYAVKPVLQNICLSVPAGKCAVIMGASGSGKSTLLQLILRFYPWQMGEIFLGNENIKNFSTEDLYQRISALTPYNHLFHDTLRKNMQYARSDISNAEIERILSELNLAAINQRFLLNETNLGESGNQLSGGEKRRLLIAQTMMRKADLYLLDEPTESLDYSTEQKVLTFLHQRLKGKTSVIVTHREALLDLADLLFVMDETGHLSQK